MDLSGFSSGIGGTVLKVEGPKFWAHLDLVRVRMAYGYIQVVELARRIGYYKEGEVQWGNGAREEDEVKGSWC